MVAFGVQLLDPSHTVSLWNSWCWLTRTAQPMCFLSPSVCVHTNPATFSPKSGIPSVVTLGTLWYSITCELYQDLQVMPPLGLPQGSQRPASDLLMAEQCSPGSHHGPASDFPAALSTAPGPATSKPIPPNGIHICIYLSIYLYVYVYRYL